MSLPLPTIAARMLTVSCLGFPSSLDKIDRLIVEGSAPISVLVALISADPLLTAQVLGQANSSSGAELTQLTNAMTHLGLGSVHGLVKGSLPIPDTLRRDLAGCWSLANACANMTRILADYCTPTLGAKADEETLHAAGLLHDLGTIVALMHFNDEYQRAVARLDERGAHLNRLLREELGADQVALGTLLATYWRLPPLITACIRYHQRPLQADGFQETVALVHVARGLVRACGFVAGPDRFLDPLDEEAMLLLKLRISDLERILDRFYDQMEELELYEGVLARS
ncbi:MAG TPA: HDOD domain-containing protein [Planctomycetota bacterium]|jgi:HD-like signal output (HDOD) protein|nr:HDOD domain-containing protein [Planctomycetota bacterium]